MGHDSFVWDTTHSYETWLIHMRPASFIWDLTQSYETWLSHMGHDSVIWDLTHSYETWLSNIESVLHHRRATHPCSRWDMTHSSKEPYIHIQQVGLIKETYTLDLLTLPSTRRLQGGLTFSRQTRGGGLGSRPIFKKFHETYAPS